MRKLILAATIALPMMNCTSKKKNNPPSPEIVAQTPPTTTTTETGNPPFEKPETTTETGNPPFEKPETTIRNPPFETMPTKAEPLPPSVVLPPEMGPEIAAVPIAANGFPLVPTQPPIENYHVILINGSLRPMTPLPPAILCQNTAVVYFYQPCGGGLLMWGKMAPLPPPMPTCGYFVCRR